MALVLVLVTTGVLPTAGAIAVVSVNFFSSVVILVVLLVADCGGCAVSATSCCTGASSRGAV